MLSLLLAMTFSRDTAADTRRVYDTAITHYIGISDDMIAFYYISAITHALALKMIYITADGQRAWRALTCAHYSMVQLATYSHRCRFHAVLLAGRNYC